MGASFAVRLQPRSKELKNLRRNNPFELFLLENSKKYLLENPDIYEEIIKKVRSFMGLDVDEKK